MLISDLLIKARQLHGAAPGGLSLIVVDYLQLLRSKRRRADENRYVEISEISGELKMLAKELNVPVLVLSQLNRNPETRMGGWPRLNDLRDSGSIEDDADLVALLHRPEYYAESEEEREKLLGEAILNIAKQRNGPTGALKLMFIKQFTRFEDVAPFTT